MPAFEGIPTCIRSPEATLEFLHLTRALLKSNVFGPAAWDSWRNNPDQFVERELAQFFAVRLPRFLQETLDLQITLSPKMLPCGFETVPVHPGRWYLSFACERGLVLHLEALIREMRAVSEPFLVTALAYVSATIESVLPVFDWANALSYYDMVYFVGAQRYSSGFPVGAAEEGGEEIEIWADMPEALRPLLSVCGLKARRFQQACTALPEGRLKQALFLCRSLRRITGRDWPWPLHRFCEEQLFDTGEPLPGLVLAVHEADGIYAQWDAYWQSSMDSMPMPFRIFPLSVRKLETVGRAFRAAARFCRQLHRLEQLIGLIDSDSGAAICGPAPGKGGVLT